MVVVMPEASLLVSATTDTPPRLNIKKVEGLVHVLQDGTVRVQRAKRLPLTKKAAPIKEAITATLAFFSDGIAEKDIAGKAFTDRPDFAAAAEADSELAATYYHREALTLVGAREKLATWVASTEGFLGGAHPYSSRTILVVDMETGATQNLLSQFKGRDLVTEALGDKSSETDCLRRLVGVAPVDGILGTEVWVAAFGHTFEFCAGGLRMHQVNGPAGTSPRPASEITFVDGTLAIPSRSVRWTGVADARVSSGSDAAVLIMGLGQGDHLVPVWSATERRATALPSRELRVVPRRS